MTTRCPTGMEWDDWKRCVSSFIDQVEGQVNDLDGKVNVLTSRISPLEGQVNDLDGKVNALIAAITHLKGQVANLLAEPLLLPVPAPPPGP